MSKRVLLAAVAAAAVVAGCGGDDSNEALTYDGFVAAANGICSDVNAAVDPLSEDFTGDPDKDVALYDDLVPALEDGIADLKDLDPPAELQDALDDFTTLTDQQLEGARDAQAAAEAGDQEEYIRILETIGELSADTDLAASKMGAQDCID